LGGSGNFIVEPLLTDATHISSISPCRAAGSVTYATGKDIDGQAWATPPPIGCDEFYSGSVTGALSVTTQALHTNLAVGYAGGFTAQIAGRAAANRWEFGDGTVVSNRLSVTHAWAAPGSYAVIFRAYNDTYPAGISTTITVYVVTQPIHYVVAGNATPVAPYNSWGTAAAKIQDAVDAATVAGALVLVTNGNYQTGATQFGAVLSNRVAVTKPLVVRSVNGPAVTAIQGYQVPGTTNGAGAVRCVLLTSGARLSGFTLTNGATRTDGDVLLDQSGGGVRGELNTVVSNCVIVACAANATGGGVSGGRVESSTLTRNRAADNGGAAFESVLNTCVLSGNSAANAGGAIYSCETSGSILTNNTAVHGGAAYACLVRNSALAANVASTSGGGAHSSTLNNCTLTGNSASQGGGAMDSALYNCIAYYNVAAREENHSGGALEFSCTTPLPAGAGNTSAEPQLADFAHVSATSPCRGAGSGAYAAAADLDGEMWLAPPSMGCDEFYSGAITGVLSVAVQTLQTNLATGFTANFTALVNGHASANRWNFGDGTVLSNRLGTAHAWLIAGNYEVIFTAFNDSNPSGVSATTTVHVVSQPVHYVALGNPTPVAPYLSWATAAADIQSAVDAASVAGALVRVSNGVYSAGGRTVNATVTNRVAVTKPLFVQSVGGPAATVISGNPVIGPAAVRGLYLASGAVLSGFTITNGAVSNSGDPVHDMSGAGVWCEPAGAMITNCVIAGNSAYLSGGGVFSGTLYDCALFNNSADGDAGGGAHLATLNHCVVRNNTARYGAGAHSSVMNQCQVLTNTASSSGGGAYSSLLNRCTLIGNHGGNTGGGAQSSTLNDCLVFANATWEGAAGAYVSTLVNCTVVGNSSGGTAYCTVKNCIVFNNNGDNHSGSTLDYSCTEPPPGAGIGNISLPPLFVNPATGDFHLQASSPCINAGNNASAAAGPDLDGLTRIVGGTVDMGAYELQTPPLQFLSPLCGFHGNAAFQLTFSGNANDAYNVWASTNLVNWSLLGPAQASAPGVFQYLDTSATNWPRRFYRAQSP
jgi:PKD repeat protein